MTNPVELRCMAELTYILLSYHSTIVGRRNFRIGRAMGTQSFSAGRNQSMPPSRATCTNWGMPRRAPDPIPNLKAQLRQAVVDALDGWSQVNAAWWIGSDQGRVSDLRRNKLERFSVEQLIRFLSRVDRRVELVVHHERRRFRSRSAGQQAPRGP